MYPSSSNNNSNFNQAYFLNNEYPVNSEFSSFFDSPTMQNYDFEHVSRQFHHLFHEDDCLGTNQSSTAAAAVTATTAAIAHGGNDDYCKGDEDEDRKIPKRRSSKKDRHSKINTANGPRDRRVRLSRDVAPKFFGLQDMLGFDKPSKTVLWLLNNSSSAIRELIQGPCTTSVSSTTTECEEVVSGVDHDKSTNTCDYKSSLDKPSCTKEATSSKGKKSKTARPTVAKESRKKARERARARANEKRSLVENEGRTLVTTDHHTTYEMLETRDDHYNWNSTAVVSNYNNQPNSGEEPQFTDFVFW